MSGLLALEHDVYAEHTLIVLDRTGDTKVEWDNEKAPEVENARRTFNELRGKGYAAYRMKKDGSKGEVIRDFDTHAERLILAPPMVGG